MYACRRLGLATPLLALAACAQAAGAGPVTSANLAARLTTLRGGETLVLPPGDYGQLVFPKVMYRRSITLDARQARFSGLVLQGTGNVTIRGGTVAGPGGKSYGVTISGARNIRIEGMTIGGTARGIVTGESQDIALVGNTLRGLRTDGINVANSTRVMIARNTCRDFNPIPAVYDAAGRRLRDGDHPDCIQLWSRPPTPTSRVAIVDNDIEGAMQGIFLGNHVRNGVDDGGFDRILIRGNRVKVASPTGIRIMDGRDSAIIDNDVSTVPGTVMANNPNKIVRANLSGVGSNLVQCGNRVADVNVREAALRCTPAQAAQAARLAELGGD